MTQEKTQLQAPLGEPLMFGDRLRDWFRRTGSQALGWFLLIIGVPLLPLPGPGTLVLVSGVALLAPHYAWAQRILGPLQTKAIEAARFGVATWPRILFSVAGGVWLFACGVVWWIKPEIPEFSIIGIGFGPQLPAAGWGTALGFFASAIAAWALLYYSVIRYRPEAEES